jgi:hypothetical protein
MDTTNAQYLNSLVEKPPTPQEILRSMLSPGGRSTFLLGCFEKRVTLFHQQVRALNLVYALNTLGYCQDANVAVVGAGVAGLTAAAALARIPGCQVTVIERGDRLLPVLNRDGVAVGRFLSPVLYEWPLVKPSQETFNRFFGSTPMTGWREGSQRSVVDWFLDEWEIHRGSARVVCGAANVALHPADSENKIVVSWESVGLQQDRGDLFDIVILAIGFGAERMLGLPDARSYWEYDDLEGLLANVNTCLVSGSGDGGWTDVFRIILRGFRQERLISDYLSDRFVSDEIKGRLIEIEEKAIRAQIIGRDPDAFITKAYLELKTPELVSRLASHDQLNNPDARVVLNAPSAFLSRGSFIANRFLGSRLIQAGVIDHWPGRIAAVGGKHCQPPWSVVLTNGEADQFERVIVRHGPEPALKAFDAQLFASCEASMRNIAQIDRTCLPAWPTEGFDYDAALRSPQQPAALLGPQIEAFNSIARYRRVIRQRAYSLYPDLTFEGAPMQICALDGAPLDSDLLENLLAESTLILSHDPWDRSEVDRWLYSILLHAESDPPRIGFERRYTPLVLPAWRLDPHRGSNAADVVAEVLNEMYGLHLSGQDLLRWSPQADIQWLAILANPLGDARLLRDSLEWLQADLGRQYGFHWIVIEENHASPLTHRGASVSLRLATASSFDNSAEEDDEIRNRLRELVSEAEITSVVLRAAKEIFKPARADGITTRILFAEAYAARVLGELERDDVERVSIVAEELYRDRGRIPLDSLRERLAAEASEFLEREGLDRFLSQLLAASIISYEYKASSLQRHLSADDPFVGMPDRFLHVYLTALYLVHNPSRLEHVFSELSHLERWKSVLEWTAQIIGSRLPERVDSFKSLLAPLLDAPDYTQRRMLARLLIAAPNVLGDMSLIVAQRFLANLDSPYMEDLQIAGRLAAAGHVDVSERLRSLTTPREGDQEWISVVAAGEFFIAARSDDARARLIAAARPKGGHVKLNQRRAIEALFEGGDRELAREIAFAIVSDESIDGTDRVRIATIGSNWGHEGSREKLKQLALSGDTSAIRLAAANSLQLQGDQATAGKALWTILEELGPCPDQRGAVQRLIYRGEHLTQSVRLVSSLRKIAAGRQSREETDHAFWAAEKLEELGFQNDMSEIWIQLGAEDGLDVGKRVEALRHGLADVLAHDRAAGALRCLAVQNDIPAKDRIEAARALRADSEDKRLPDDLQAVMQQLADDQAQRPEDRAAAAMLAARDPALALLNMGHVGDRSIRFACVDQLIELGASAFARELLLDIIRNVETPLESMYESLWKLARFKDWDELIALTELDDIRGPSLDVVLGIFGEMGQTAKLRPVIQRVIFERSGWSQERERMITYWARSHRSEAREVLRDLEANAAADEYIGKVREVLEAGVDEAGRP